MQLEELLGIELPIVQAPMAGVQGSAMAVAVSEAGGLGSLPCAMLTAETMKSELAAIHAQTARPYNVNFFCHSEPRADAAIDAAWRTSLEPYYTELGVDADANTQGASRLPFDRATAELIGHFRPRIVSFHFGLPEEALLAYVRSWGAKILSSATTVEEANWLASRGVDAVIAQGLEAGGHRGSFLSDDLTSQLGTFALVPQIVRAVNVPVIAAGGIADAAGVSAAITLGAIAAQVGTAYLLCPEATTPATHRAALSSESARHTVVTNVFSGRPARGIVNRLIREVGPMSCLAPAFPLASAAVAPLRAKAESIGSGDFSPLWAGQNTSGCKPVSASELTRELAEPSVVRHRS
jgi:nitronate monooxygenase